MPRASVAPPMNKSLFTGMLGNNVFKTILTSPDPNKPESEEEKEEPQSEGWHFYIFEMGKKKYHSFQTKNKNNFKKVNLDPNDETLIICVNFTEKELRTL